MDIEKKIEELERKLTANIDRDWETIFINT